MCADLVDTIKRTVRKLRIKWSLFRIIFSERCKQR